MAGVVVPLKVWQSVRVRLLEIQKMTSRLLAELDLIRPADELDEGTPNLKVPVVTPDSGASAYPVTTLDFEQDNPSVGVEDNEAAPNFGTILNTPITK